METIRQTQKKYGSQAMIVSIFAGLALILLDHKSAGKGLILGTLFSAVNFALAGEWLQYQLGRGRAKTYALSFGSVIFRHALFAVPVILAVKLEQFNLWATVCGIFMIQIIIAGNHLFKSISPAATNWWSRG